MKAYMMIVVLLAAGFVLLSANQTTFAQLASGNNADVQQTSGDNVKATEIGANEGINRPIVPASPFTLDVTDNSQVGVSEPNPIDVSIGPNNFGLKLTAILDTQYIVTATSINPPGAGITILKGSSSNPLIPLQNANAFFITIPQNALNGAPYTFKIDARGINKPFDNASVSRTVRVVIPSNYKCYDIEREVDLRTQFGLEPGVDVNDTGEFLCAPALVNDTGNASQQNQNLTNLEKNFPHLKFYGIVAPAINVPATLRSRFGNETVIVTKPVFLGLPALKETPTYICRPVDIHPPFGLFVTFCSPKPPFIDFKGTGLSTPPVIPPGAIQVPFTVLQSFPPSLTQIGLLPEPPADPHYKCYEIEPRTRIDQSVTLLTQFNFRPFNKNIENVTVNESRLLCAPALKNDKGNASQQAQNLSLLQQKFPHLKLYSIEPAVPINITQHLKTQFGEEFNVNITRPRFLAVPVTKSVCDLAINKAVSPNPVQSGQNVTITLTVTNVGTATCGFPPLATDAFVEDSQPPGLTFNPPISSPNDWGCIFSSGNSGNLACSHSNTNELLPGYTATIQFNATVTAQNGSIINCATVTSPLDANPANDQSCATIIVQPPPPCPPTNINLSTGFNQTTNGLINFGLGDDNWNVVVDPVNTAVPRPATVVPSTLPPQIQIWPAPFLSSRWISPNAQRGINQYTGKDVTYQYNFTMPQCFSNANLSLTIRADNQALVFLNGQFLGQTPNSALGIFPITSMSTSSGFQGQNNLAVTVIDNGVFGTTGITGFDLVGTVTAN